MTRTIGRCIGETSPVEVSFISKEMPQIGEYVSMEYDGKNVLGMIESLVRGSVSINDDIYDPKTVEKIKQIEGDDHYIRGSVRILGDIDHLRIPRTPPTPGTAITVADPAILQKIFKVKGSGLKLGNLISQEEVEVEVDINKMITRHLAILAMTGAGKSNTVAVIINGVLKVNGCVIVFDMHSEYVNAEFEYGSVNPIKARINPLYLSFAEIKKLANIPEKAYIQERYFNKAHQRAKNAIENGTNLDYFTIITQILEKWIESDDPQFNDTKSVTAVLNKIDYLKQKYSNILDLNSPDILDKIQLNSANVIDLGSVDETAAETIVSHVLRNALNKRKNHIRKLEKDVLNHPVFFVLEEAHILAPKSRSARSKYWISRIAREGRKFGVGLCMVSQSPKSLDPDSLSQANNMIILRLVEPQDQRHVQTASESLSDDLLKQLPSLNIGEAIVLGLMSKIPTLVKIDEFVGKLTGGDLDLVEEWKKCIENEKQLLEEQEEELEELEEEY
ncbi:helicase HerA-like domain-containing protein [Methanobacterium sp. ACI-7]|uniref:helicase HerA-like domain-containing protein n=1 Tax=unclassified Methanobacterium TaxID=2627676 RepID=UPI0039C010E4